MARCSKREGRCSGPQCLIDRVATNRCEEIQCCQRGEGEAQSCPADDKLCGNPPTAELISSLRAAADGPRLQADAGRAGSRAKMMPKRRPRSDQDCVRIPAHERSHPSRKQIRTSPAGHTRPAGLRAGCHCGRASRWCWQVRGARGERLHPRSPGVAESQVAKSSHLVKASKRPPLLTGDTKFPERFTPAEL